MVESLAMAERALQGPTSEGTHTHEITRSLQTQLPWARPVWRSSWNSWVARLPRRRRADRCPSRWTSSEAAPPWRPPEPPTWSAEGRRRTCTPITFTWSFTWQSPAVPPSSLPRSTNKMRLWFHERVFTTSPFSLCFPVFSSFKIYFVRYFNLGLNYIY